MNFSVHTFELSLDPDKHKYEELKSIAYANAEDSHRIIKTTKSDYCVAYADKALASEGIRVEYHEDFLQKKIKLIVNPSKVLGGDDIPKLWKPTDRNIKALLRDLKIHINDYFDSEYKLNDFKLTRIDFTVNIDVGSRESVSNYIKILHNLGKVKGFAPKYKKSNIWIDKTLSFDLKGTSRKGIEFSAYDKEAQSGNKEAKGILCVEIRLMNFEITGEDSRLSDQIKYLSQHSKEVFMRFFQLIVPRGDYYNKKQAVSLIEDNIASIIPNKRERENMLGKMIKLLELVPVKKSLLLAQKALKDRNIKGVMAAFAELNVSPVTISKNMKLKHLVSLYSYLEE